MSSRHEEGLESFIEQNEYELALGWIEQHTWLHEEYMEYLEKEYNSRYEAARDLAIDLEKERRMGL